MESRVSFIPATWAANIWHEMYGAHHFGLVGMLKPDTVW